MTSQSCDIEHCEKEGPSEMKDRKFLMKEEEKEEGKEEEDDDQEEEGCPNPREALERELKLYRSTETTMQSSPTTLNPDLHKKTRQYCSQVFEGVKKTPPLGRPGNLLVFGQNAVPLLASNEKVVMAASTLGQGRFLFIASQALCRGIKAPNCNQLQINMKQWLLPTDNTLNIHTQHSSISTHTSLESTLNTQVPTQNIQEPSEIVRSPNENNQGPTHNTQVPTQNTQVPTQNASVPSQNVSNSAKIQIIDVSTVADWNKLDHTSTIVYSSDFDAVLNVREQLLWFVSSGGGFLLAFRPWYWRSQQSGAKSTGDDVMEKVAQLLTPLGIGFNFEMQYGAQGFPTPLNNERAYSRLLMNHSGHVLDCCCHSDMAAMTYHVTFIDNFLRKAPPFVKHALDEKISELFHRCHDSIKSDIPGPDHSLSDPAKLGALAMCNKMSLYGSGYHKAPGVDQFPGDVKDSTQLLECIEVQLTSYVKRLHSTGYYLTAGAKLVLEVLNISSDDWMIRIGAHSDRLYKKQSLKRWPEISIMHTIKSDKLTYTSAFGGSIYLFSPDGKSEIRLRLSNVVEAPWFDGKNPDLKWELHKNAPAPWAEIEGNYIRFTLPSSSVRSMNEFELKTVINEWDRVVELYHGLRGTDISKSRGEWIVADIQIGAGSMHSGYPIMGMMGITQGGGFVLNMEKLTHGGMWGPFHELGHNMQKQMWTLQNGGEVTCNIFSLYACEMVSGVPVSKNERIIGSKQLRQVKTFFQTDILLTEQSNPWIGLGFYAHLILTFGWEGIQKTFHKYETFSREEVRNILKDKVNVWLDVFSHEVGVSIAPIMYLWNVGAKKEGEERVNDLKPFLPEDKFTALASEEKMSEIVKKYPRLIRHLSNK